MVRLEKMTSLFLCPISVDTAAPLLAPALGAGRDTTGGLMSIGDLLNGAACIQVIAEDGETVGAYAVERVEHKNGAEMVLVAGVGHLPGADLTKAVIPAVVDQARAANCRALTIHTRRRGLVAKLQAQGFEIDGFIMRKKITNGR